jgi:hypothetical protein
VAHAALMWASPIPRYVGCRHAQASVVLRRSVRIIVMSVTGVTLPVFIEYCVTLHVRSLDCLVIVTVTVTQETSYLSGLLAAVTAMTVIYGLILDRVRSSTS